MGLDPIVRPARMLRPAELERAALVVLCPMGVDRLASLVGMVLVWGVDLSRAVIVCIGEAAPLAPDCLAALGARDVLAWPRLSGPGRSAR